MGNESISKVSLLPSWGTILSALLLLALLILPLAPRALGGPDKGADVRAQAIAMFAKALAISDLRAPGSPPFEMRATISAEQTNGKPSITGVYFLKWVSPEQWREEIHFANYTRIRVGGKNQYWQSRTTPYEVLPVLELCKGLDFLKDLHVWSRDAAVAGLGAIKFHQQKVHGIKLNCVTLKQKRQNYGPRYCFDPATGTLDSSGPIEFSNFISFGGKYFPGDIREEEKPANPITFHVNSISPLGETESVDFQPPENSTAWPSCDDPDNLPIIESQAPPVYPASERFAYKEGIVFVYVIIGTDGQLSNLKLLSATDSAFANSALSALRQWKYAPETCHGIPVPIETLIHVIYKLKY